MREDRVGVARRGDTIVLEVEGLTPDQMKALQAKLDAVSAVTGVFYAVLDPAVRLARIEPAHADGGGYFAPPEVAAALASQTLPEGYTSAAQSTAEYVLYYGSNVVDRGKDLPALEIRAARMHRIRTTLHERGARLGSFLAEVDPWAHPTAAPMLVEYVGFVDTPAACDHLIVVRVMKTHSNDARFATGTLHMIDVDAIEEESFIEAGEPA